MARKRYPSDLTTTTVRVTKTRHKQIKKHARKEKQFIDDFVDKTFAMVLDVPKI